jgi:hypothetical protein
MSGILSMVIQLTAESLTAGVLYVFSLFPRRRYMLLSKKQLADDSRQQKRLAHSSLHEMRSDNASVYVFICGDVELDIGYHTPPRINLRNIRHGQ